jgi:hypothetical protein
MAKSSGSEAVKSPPTTQKLSTEVISKQQTVYNAPKEEPVKQQFMFESTISASGIVRSVSDYKTSELAGDMRMSLRKSRTDVFHQSPGELLYKKCSNL